MLRESTPSNIRCSTPQSSTAGCRWFFIAVQFALVLAWCGFLTETYSDLCFWMLVITIALLLFVMPWFWASLRYVALVGWVLAAASVLSFTLLTRGGHG